MNIEAISFEVNDMEIEKILLAVDHTLLRQTATWEEIREICDDGVKYGCASVCIPPSFVKQAADYLGDKLPVCTVIGFPNGYSTTAVKVFETENAIANGAREIDMVVNLGWVKDGRWADILDEIRAVKAACGRFILKVIVETCLLTQEEKVKLCQIVSDSGADYIKTSTGFSTAGATREDVALFRANVAPHVKIKAAGGISTLSDGADFLALGADRLGTSRIVKLVKEKV
jgi:deoxyribose-phosphate aldolase